MKITRIYAGSDGESHFEDIHIPLKDAGEIGSLSRVFPATGVIFRETGGHYDYHWHNAPCRQLVLMLGARRASAGLVLGPEQRVQAGGSDITVSAYSVPSFMEWDGDDLRGLIVGEANATGCT